MLEDVACIDLGSSYTKISIRNGLNTDATVVGDRKTQDPSEKFVYPSVLVRIVRKGQERWMHGRTAAEFAPMQGVEFFRDWKSLFFGRNNDYAFADQLAHQFFIGLKDFLATGSPELSKVLKNPARICIPKLPGSNERGTRLVEIARDVGFEFANDEPFIFEAHSNVFGVLTRGRNETWIPKRQRQREGPRPNYSKIFNHDPMGYLKKLNGAVNESSKFKHSVLVVDIGSFTLDVGAAVFQMVNNDPSETDRPYIVQSSFELGIRDLDARVKESLSTPAQDACKSLSSADWDRRKTVLYQGEDVVLQPPGLPAIKLDGDVHHKVAQVLSEFGNEIFTKVKEFVDERELEVDQVIVTGGGMAIEKIRAPIISNFSNANLVVNLFDEEEPYKSLKEKRKGDEWYYDPQEIDKRRKKNAELVRGASAIGGCSILFDLN